MYLPSRPCRAVPCRAHARNGKRDPFHSCVQLTAGAHAAGVNACMPGRPVAAFFSMQNPQVCAGKGETGAQGGRPMHLLGLGWDGN
jgi:hypothetical protein